MKRQEITERIGSKYHTANIEEDEWSYAKDAGTLGQLEDKVGHKVSHFKLDRRFECEDENGKYVVLVETKQNFVDADEEQLKCYLEEERALHKGEKVICILANTNDDRIRVWKSEIDDDHILEEETVIDTMEHYIHIFAVERQNDRETVMRNTYSLNELLHKKDIDEATRSQFVGTCLLFVKDQVQRLCHGGHINDTMKEYLCKVWSTQTPKALRSGIAEVLERLLDGSVNKSKKIELLQRNVLESQHVIELTLGEWIEILSFILMKIFRYIDDDSSEGQDILNLFFITFNKYTGNSIPSLHDDI